MEEMIGESDQSEPLTYFSREKSCHELVSLSSCGSTRQLVCCSTYLGRKAEENHDEGNDLFEVNVRGDLHDEE